MKPSVNKASEIKKDEGVEIHFIFQKVKSSTSFLRNNEGH